MRQGIKNAQAIASFLEEHAKPSGFWITNAKLPQTLIKVSSRDIIKDLINAGLVNHGDGDGEKWHLVYPTDKLLQRLRPLKELSKRSFETDKTLADHEARIQALERAVRNIITKLDPPFTEDKYKQYTQETTNDDLWDK
jgi:hypothetical protein